MTSTWQDISTAPRDGRWVLLCTRGGACQIAFWNGRAWDDGDFNSSMPDSLFTHWQELPSLPSPPEGR